MKYKKSRLDWSEYTNIVQPLLMHYNDTTLLYTSAMLVVYIYAYHYYSYDNHVVVTTCSTNTKLILYVNWTNSTNKSQCTRLLEHSSPYVPTNKNAHDNKNK